VLGFVSVPANGVFMRLLAALALLLSPGLAFAAGSDDAEPPKPTATTTECTDGQVYDEETKACVVPEDSSLNDDERYRAVRELAYAGEPEAAMRVLAAMTEGQTDRVLTYTGFLNRQMGQWEAGLAAYEQALTLNPDNVLARSYYGQALVLMNETALAQGQLDEIRARGGAGTWAEASLANAILTGTTTTY
jgi:tetratricopeptide (TPR) repeat protein